jgi:NAD+ synthase (glutamine-hydrolysing)
MTISNTPNSYIKADRSLNKISLAQLSFPGGRIEENKKKIISHIKSSRETSSDLVIFPELSIPGYCHMDLAYDQDFISNNKKALNEIIEESKGIAVILGFIDQDENKIAPGNRPWIYNSLAFIQDQKLLYVQHKELLPNYGVFNEKRYFQSGIENEKKIIEFSDSKKIGLLICEDLWSKEYERDLSLELKNLGADYIFSINASPYCLGRLKTRIEILKENSTEKCTNLIYLNTTGSYDSYDGELLFDGNSLVLNNKGEIISSLGSFKEEVKTFTLNKETQEKDNIQKIEILDDISTIYDGLTIGIRDFFSRKNLKKAYIGLSGGIDSALVCALSVNALGSENVIGITMPSHITSEETKNDAHLLASNLNIKIIERPIVKEYRAWISQFEENKLNSITKQNKQARIRQSILMEYTNEDPSSALLNTGNKTEIALGYFTLGGDSAGALSVLGDINKFQVYELSKYINRINKNELIPESTISRAPTAELEEGQTDEKSLSATYSILVPLVDNIIVNNLSKTKLYELYDKNIVDKVFSLIKNSEGKRRQLPPAIRVSQKCFGLERRIPMDHTF